MITLWSQIPQSTSASSHVYYLCLYLSFQLAESSMFNVQKYDQYLLCIVSTIEVMYCTITGVMAAGWGAPPWNVPVTRPCSWLLVPRYQDHVAHSRLVTMVTMVTCCQELIKCFRSNNPATSISGVVRQSLTAALLHCWHLLIQWYSYVVITQRLLQSAACCHGSLAAGCIDAEKYRN